MKRIIGGRISLTNNYIKHDNPLNVVEKKIEVVPVKVEPVKVNSSIENKKVEPKPDPNQITKITRNDKILKFINFKV
jgi:hypothetical protein